MRGSWLAAFTSGLAEMQDAFAVPLAGGDTVATPGPLSLSITAFGLAPEAGAMRRSGARPGDDIWVSGTIGDGALGLRVLTGALTLDDSGAGIGAGRPVSAAAATAGVGAGARRSGACLRRRLGRTDCRPRPHLRCLVGDGSGRSRAGCHCRRRRGRRSGAIPSCWVTVFAGGDDYELGFHRCRCRFGGDRAGGRRCRYACRNHRPNRRNARGGRGITGDGARTSDGRPVNAGGAGWRHF